MSWRELLGNEKPMRGPVQSAMDIRYDKSMKVGESPLPGFVLRRILRGYEGKVFEFEWSPDGEILAAACSDGMIRLWDMQSDEPLRILRAHNEEVTELAWSPDGRTLASGSWDKTIQVWEI